MDGWFEARETACYAKAAKERWEKDHSERNKSGDLVSRPGKGRSCTWWTPLRLSETVNSLSVVGEESYLGR